MPQFWKSRSKAIQKPSKANLKIWHWKFITSRLGVALSSAVDRAAYRFKGILMKKTDYSSVHTLIAMDNRAVRTGLRQVLNANGFGSFTEAANEQSLQTAIKESSFELIIISSEINGFFVAPRVASICNGRTWRNIW